MHPDGTGSGEGGPASHEPLAGARLRRLYDEETGSTLRPALIVVGLTSALYVPAHLQLGVPGARPLALGTGLVAAAFLAAWVWTRTHPVPARLSHPAYAVVVLLTACLAVWDQAVRDDPLRTTNLAIIVITTGMCIVDWRWALAATLPPAAVWFTFAAPEPQTPQFSTTATSVLFGFAAAAIVNTGRRRAIARVAEATDAAERAALLDALTQTYNRRGLERVATELAAGARRAEQQVGVLLLDIDDFKSVNDTLGHAAGDTVLVAVADALRSASRGSDVVGRWGGDEFVVVTTGAPMPVDELARRVELVLARRRGAGSLPAISVSVGSASAPASGDHPVETLIAAADADMYARRTARRAGRRPETLR